jgi:hypothetical protein
MAGKRGPRLLGDKGDVRLLAMKLPANLLTAIQAAATANYEAVPAYVRRVLIERLRADGVLPPVTFKDLEMKSDE